MLRCNRPRGRRPTARGANNNNDHLQKQTIRDSWNIYRRRGGARGGRTRGSRLHPGSYGTESRGFIPGSREPLSHGSRELSPTSKFFPSESAGGLQQRVPKGVRSTARRLLRRREEADPWAFDNTTNNEGPQSPSSYEAQNPDPWDFDGTISESPVVEPSGRGRAGGDADPWAFDRTDDSTTESRARARSWRQEELDRARRPVSLFGSRSSPNLRGAMRSIVSGLRSTPADGADQAEGEGEAARLPFTYTDVRVKDGHTFSDLRTGYPDESEDVVQCDSDVVVESSDEETDRPGGEDEPQRRAELAQGGE